MKTVFTTLFFVLSISVSFSSFGQVFFKQRVYGMKDREPKKEVIYLGRTYSSSYSSNSKKSNKNYYYISNSTQAVSWKTAELRTKRQFGFYFIGIKGTNYLTPLKPAAQTFRELGEEDLANSLLRARTTFIFAKSTQIASWIVGVPAFMIIWVDNGDPYFVNKDHYNVLYACIGTWVASKTVMLLSRASINNTLRKHNNRIINSEDKNFSNFIPSSITFKPIQIRPFTPSITPSLGLSWKL